MGANRVSSKPAWLRCPGCYGTGYTVTTGTADAKKGILGSITNEKCTDCDGSGYIKVEP